MSLNDFTLPDDGKTPQFQADGHPSLKEFDLGFDMIKGRPFPRENCKQVLMLLTEVCPELEVVRFGELFFVDGGGGIDERDDRLDWLMDMRRTAEGDWEEREWGVVVTPI